MIVPLSRKNKYLVSFFYSKVKRHDGVHKRHTQCFIKQFEAGIPGKELPVLAKGYARLSREDQFNKKAGRKIAFTRALFNLFPSAVSTKKPLSLENAEKNRGLRAKFWKKFLKEIAI